MTIEYNDIHTAKKQALLHSKMSAIAARVREIPNDATPVTNCPICSASVTYFTEAYGFTMSRCSSCHLIFCNPYPSESQLDLYYNSEMKEFENEFFRESFEKRLELFGPRINLIRQHRSNGRLLEIGSAIGVFITALRKAGAPFEITACDRSHSACAELAARFPDIQILEGDINALPSGTQFDVIAMWDTIEHVVDQKALLASLHRLLDGEGILVFSTPNTRSFEWIVADVDHVQVLPPAHVNLLNPACISLLLDATGFSVVEQHTLNAQLDITYIQKMRAQGEINSVRLGAFLDLALDDEQFCAALSDYLIGARLAGNIVTVARKR